MLVLMAWEKSFIGSLHRNKGTSQGVAGQGCRLPTAVAFAGMHGLRLNRKAEPILFKIAHLEPVPLSLEALPPFARQVVFPVNRGREQLTCLRRSEFLFLRTPQQIKLIGGRSVWESRETRSGVLSCRSVVEYGGGLRMIGIAGPDDGAC